MIAAMTAQRPEASTAAHGILFILSGPSGVGKDTVLRHALPRVGGIRTSISLTTRPPRADEHDGVDYCFVSPEDFAQRLARGELLEHAEVHGHLYGTPRPWMLEQLRAGMDVVLEIDVQGALQVRAVFPDAVLIFLAPPNWHELARRLRARQTEDEESIRRRLENARREMRQIHEYHYLIFNDRLADATDLLCDIINAERCRPWRQALERLDEVTPDA